MPTSTRAKSGCRTTSGAPIRWRTRYIGFLPLKERLESFYARGVFVRPSGVDPNAPVTSSRVYGPTLKPKEARRRAEEDRRKAESIQV